MFPAGSVEINRKPACRTAGEKGFCFDGQLPGFTHAKSDLASFCLFTRRLIVEGSETQGRIAMAFGVPLVSIKQSAPLLGKRGAAGFFQPAACREGSKLDRQKIEHARARILQGDRLNVVSQETGLLVDALRKTIPAGWLPVLKEHDSPCQPTPSVEALEAPALKPEVSDSAATTAGQRCFEVAQTAEPRLTHPAVVLIMENAQKTLCC